MNHVVSKLSKLSNRQRRALINSLSPKEIKELLGYWPLWARPGQLPPSESWKVWVIQGGKGTGKTRAALEQFHIELSTKPLKRGLILGISKRIAIEGTITGNSGLLNFIHNNSATFRASESSLHYVNGSVGLVNGYSAAINLSSFDLVICEDIHLWPDPTAWLEIVSQVQTGLLGRCIITCSSELPLMLLNRINSEILSVSYLENEAPSRPSIHLVVDQADKVHLPLVAKKELTELRVSELPTLKKVAVSIDPSVSRHGCETGIVICGLSYKGHIYVLGDDSIKAHPSEWATIAVAAYHSHHANVLIYENNQGGELISNLIAGIDPTVNVLASRANSSKVSRLLPLSKLLERGMFHLYGHFPQLEKQMTSWMAGSKSPDRLDSLAWCVNHLTWST